MIWNDQGLDYLRLEKELALQHVYQDSLKEIREKLRRIEGKTYSEAVKFHRLEKLEKDLTHELQKMGQKVKTITRKGIKDTFAESYHLTGYAVENHTGINLGFTQLPVETIEKAIEDPYDWIKRTGNHGRILKQRLKDTIVRGLIQGYGYKKLSKSLAKSMGQGLGESTRLLRTEMHRAQVKGRLMAIDKTEAACEKMGVKTERSWRSAYDDRTRSSHVEMGGVLANKKTKLFTLPSGAKTEGPGLSGIGSEDINCRCTIRVLFPDFEPDIDESLAMEKGQGFSCLMKNHE